MEDAMHISTFDYLDLYTRDALKREQEGKTLGTDAPLRGAIYQVIGEKAKDAAYTISAADANAIMAILDGPAARAKYMDDHAVHKLADGASDEQLSLGWSATQGICNDAIEALTRAAGLHWGGDMSAC
jgi:hypothetical protein